MIGLVVYTILQIGLLAQWLECLPYMQLVIGSSPIETTNSNMMKKFKTILEGVDKTNTSLKCSVDYENMGRELGIFVSFREDAHLAVEKRLKSWYVLRWALSDQHAGIRACFFDDELVCTIGNYEYEGNTDYKWVSEEALQKVKDFLWSVVNPRHHDMLDMNEEMPDRYNLCYQDQILCERGWYQNTPVKILNKKHPNETEALVELPSGEVKVVSVEEIYFDYNT